MIPCSGDRLRVRRNAGVDAWPVYSADCRRDAHTMGTPGRRGVASPAALSAVEEPVQRRWKQPCSGGMDEKTGRTRGTSVSITLRPRVRFGLSTMGPYMPAVHCLTKRGLQALRHDFWGI